MRGLGMLLQAFCRLFGEVLWTTYMIQAQVVGLEGSSQH